MVIDATYAVFINMGELCLDPCTIETLFMQYR